MHVTTYIGNSFYYRIFLLLFFFCHLGFADHDSTRYEDETYLIFRKEYVVLICMAVMVFLLVLVAICAICCLSKSKTRIQYVYITEDNKKIIKEEGIMEDIPEESFNLKEPDREPLTPTSDKSCSKSGGSRSGSRNGSRDGSRETLPIVINNSRPFDPPLAEEEDTSLTIDRRYNRNDYNENQSRKLIRKERYIDDDSDIEVHVIGTGNDDGTKSEEDKAADAIAYHTHY